MTDPDTLASLARLIDIMARLRAPGGCPWDREQTHDSLRPYLIEEAYEVLDAIESGDPAALCDELGDVLLQVLFHAEIAAEAGRFRLADVARSIADKLVRRHPHVFGDVRVEDAGEVARNWRRLKAEERRAAGRDRGGLLSSLPPALPALARAQRIGARLAQAGFDWPDLAGVLAKVDEERRELAEAVRAGDPAAAARELGDLLLALTSAARHLDVEAEGALRDATNRLARRVERAEAAAQAAGRRFGELGIGEQEALWRAAKTDLDAATAKPPAGRGV